MTIGNLTLKRQWIAPVNATAFVELVRTKFDNYGNPATIVDPLGQAPAGAVDLSKGHVRQVTYDGSFHAFPIQETIHLGQGKNPLTVQRPMMRVLAW